MLVDSHCHLNRLVLKDYDGSLDLAIAAAWENGLEHILNISVTFEEAPAVIAVAEQFPGKISATVGLHPSEPVLHEPTVALLTELAARESVVAIGETGLDYHYDDVSVEHQQLRFRRHIQAAKQLNKPLVIHLREASDDMLTILQEEHAEEVGGVMHCFTDTIEVAQSLIDMGFYIGLSGIVTFKNADQLRAVASMMPLDRILIETDAPYLAPVPLRGHPNEPKNVRLVAEFMADWLEMRYDDFAQITTKNFYRLFYD